MCLTARLTACLSQNGTNWLAVTRYDSPPARVNPRANFSTSPSPHVHDALEGTPACRPPANWHAPPTLPSCPSNPLLPPPGASPLLGHPDLAPNQPPGHATPRHSVTTTHGMPQRSSLHIPTDIACVVRCGKKARLARIVLKRRPYIWWWNVHR